MTTILLHSSDPRCWVEALKWSRTHGASNAHWVILTPPEEGLPIAQELGVLSPDAIKECAFFSLPGIHRVPSSLGSLLWVRIPEKHWRRELHFKVDLIAVSNLAEITSLRRFAHQETEVLGLDRESLPPFLETNAGRVRFKNAHPAFLPKPLNEVVIIGSGLAGAMVAYELGKRGVRVTVIDESPVPGGAASALYAGLFHPHWQATDSPLFRLTRLGFRLLQPLMKAFPDCFIPCGVFDMAANEEEYAKWKEHYVSEKPLALPRGFAELVNRERASSLVRVQVRRGGWWFPRAGLVHAGKLAKRLLESVHARVLTNQKVSLKRESDKWTICTPQGATFERSEHVVLASAMGIPDLLSLPREALGLSQLKGRISLLSVAPLGLSETVAMTGPGYLVKVGEHFTAVGATYEPEHQVWDVQDAHAHNWSALLELVGEKCGEGIFPAGFYQGVRAVCLDRLPLVGQGFTAETLRGCHFAGRPELEKLPVEEGLWVCGAFGSRGLTWGLACAEHLVSLMLGEPSVLEYSLSQAVHPGRFIAETLTKPVA